MDPAEVEFLAEKEEIGIVPNFSQDQIHLIGVSRSDKKGGDILGDIRGIYDIIISDTSNKHLLSHAKLFTLFKYIKKVLNVAIYTDI
jgi:hypothetical protein